MKRFEYIALSWTLVLLGAVRCSAAPFVPERNAQVVAVSSDGLLVATGKSGMSNSEFPPRPHPTIRKCGLIQIWDARTGEMLQRMQSFGDFTQLKFSPDGKRLASCRLFSPDGKLEMSEVHLWDVATGKSLHAFDRCHAFDFAPDSSAIVVLSRSKCVLYGLISFTKQFTYESLGESLTVAFSDDGTQIIAAKQTEAGVCIRACDRKTGEMLAESPTRPEPFYQLAVSPAGDVIATGHVDGTIVLWQLDQLRPVALLRAAKSSRQLPFFSRDGKQIGAGNQSTGDVVFWHVESGEQIARYTFQRGTFHTYHPRVPQSRVRPEEDPARFAFMPDGYSFFAGCFGGMIRSVATGQELKRFGY